MIARTPTEIELRVVHAQALLDDWKGRPFDWKAQAHCARLVIDHLRRNGYTPPLSKAGLFSTERAALAALRRLGTATLAEAVDLAGLPRIVPAAAIVGDVLELPSAGALGSLVVAMGNGAALGFHEDAADCIVMRPALFAAAWRVVPRG